jgi:hypothetical protein
MAIIGFNFHVNINQFQALILNQYTIFKVSKKYKKTNACLIPISSIRGFWNCTWIQRSLGFSIFFNKQILCH